jgi:integrase
MGFLHPHDALTAVKIKSAKPGRYCDGGGLYLIVDDSGAKRWVLRTLIHGKRHDLGLGSLSLVSLAEAREEANRLRKTARDGGDPLAERREKKKAVERERNIPTFEAAARQVHAEHSKSFRNPRHAAQWITSLETYAFPTIGGQRIDRIDSSDVLKVLSPIWLDIHETADRVKQRMGVVFDWSIASGFRSGNPIHGITKVLPKHSGAENHFAALPYTEVPGFIHALRKDEADTVGGRLAFELLILTASRTSEVLKATWNEIDFQGKVWTRPPEHMKAKKEHRVPLTPRCVEIFEAAKELSDGSSDFIFPGDKPGRPLSNMVFHALLRRMAKTGMTPHGFRSSFRDWAEEKTNHSQRTIETALAHVVKDKTEAAYLRTQLFEKRKELMAQWVRFATSTPAKKVVSIGR